MKSSDEKILISYRKLVAHLEAHRRALSLADCEREVLERYSSVLRFLKKLSNAQILELEHTKAKDERAPVSRLTPKLDTASLSLDEIEKLTLDEATPRKVLEEIAIFRFNVPKGSMRSFQNIRMLKEKIITRVQNERAHLTIGEVARRSEHH